MDGPGGVFWDLASAAGGTLALTFIIAIASGILALTLVFASSAVLVLERFARAAQRLPTLLFVTAVWVAVIAWLIHGWQVQQDQVLPEGYVGLPLSAVFGVAFLVVAALEGAVMGFLKLLRSRQLALLTAALLGFAYALIVGGADRMVYAIAPVAVALLAVAALFVVRRARGRGEPYEIEQIARALVLPLAVGILACALLPAPNPEVSGVGGMVLILLLAAVLVGLLPLATVGLIDTRGSAEWFIAVRYLFAKRRQTFISLITLICVGGVAVGVWLIITVLSVMNGFEGMWEDEIIRNRAHFTVYSGSGTIEDYHELVERLRALPEVVAAAPYLDAEGMVRGANGRIVGVRVRGVDPALVGDVTDLREDLVSGSLDLLQSGIASGGAEPGGTRPDGAAVDPGIVIGSGLASALGLELNDPVVLISPFGGPPTPFGPGPRLKRFRVAGVFESSFFQYDESFTYVNLPAAQDFRRTADVIEGVEVRVTNHLRSRRVADSVDRMLGFPYYTRDWKELFPAFFQALKTEQVMMFLLLTMIMVVAAFVIVATLVMMIMEKSSDIAILKAMGARDAMVERIFAIEGTLIGLFGTALGVVAGLAVTSQIAWVQERIESVLGIDTLPAAVYQFSTLPSRVETAEVVGVVAIAMILSLGATLIPSRQGARLNPAEALRYE